MKVIFWFGIVECLISCKIHPSSDHNTRGVDKQFKLNLKPAVGANYTYEVSNISDINVEVDSKKVETINKTNATVYYRINNDSSGNYILSLQYKKIHIYSKIGENESDIDAANATNSIDPTERMLGELSAAVITATVNKSGAIINTDGYHEIANKMIAGMTNTNFATKALLQKRWKDMVEQSLVKKNVEQFFRIFPDSAVHVGDKWKTVSREDNMINYQIHNQYKLIDISDGVASVESDGQITTDNLKTGYLGNDVSASLNGSQHGQFEVDIKTGMLRSGESKTNIKGTMQMLSREIPLTLKMNYTIKSVKGD